MDSQLTLVRLVENMQHLLHHRNNTSARLGEATAPHYKGRVEAKESTQRAQDKMAARSRELEARRNLAVGSIVGVVLPVKLRKKVGFANVPGIITAITKHLTYNIR